MTAPVMTSTEGDWYKVVETDELLQADVIERCPVAQIDPGSMMSVVRGDSLDLDARVIRSQPVF